VAHKVHFGYKLDIAAFARLAYFDHVFFGERAVRRAFGPALELIGVARQKDEKVAFARREPFLDEFYDQIGFLVFRPAQAYASDFAVKIFTHKFSPLILY